MGPTFVSIEFPFVFPSFPKLVSVITQVLDSLGLGVVSEQLKVGACAGANMGVGKGRGLLVGSWLQRRRRAGGHLI